MGELQEQDRANKSGEDQARGIMLGEQDASEAVMGSVPILRPDPTQFQEL
jgi:hypothetical protein